MSEMVERVARALMRSRHHSDKPAFLDDPKAGGILLPRNFQKENWDGCVADAKVAIAAMREPTETMKDAALEAGLDIYWSYEASGKPGAPEDVYRTMIDEALK